MQGIRSAAWWAILAQEQPSNQGWAEVLSSLPLNSIGTVALCTLVTVAIMRGWLVPKSTVDTLLAAYDKRSEADARLITEQGEQLGVLRSTADLSAALLNSARPRSLPGGSDDARVGP